MSNWHYIEVSKIPQLVWRQEPTLSHLENMLFRKSFDRDAELDWRKSEEKTLKFNIDGIDLFSRKLQIPAGWVATSFFFYLYSSQPGLSDKRVRFVCDGVYECAALQVSRVVSSWPTSSVLLSSCKSSCRNVSSYPIGLLWVKEEYSQKIREQLS